MIRKTIAALSLILGMAILGTGFAQEPKPDDPEPPRLKKKERPKEEPAEPPKLRPKEDEKPEPKPVEPEEDAKETLNRLNKNLRATEDRLSKKDTGDATRELQKDILKDLDSLIQQKQNPPPSDDSSSQSGKSGASGSRSQRNQQAGKKSSSSRSQSQAGRSGKGDRPDGKGEFTKSGQGNQAGMGKGDPTVKDLNKLADLYKDVWGHLPEAMRMEMDTFAREKFMPRYQELLKQYYSTLAEKGRRKE